MMKKMLNDEKDGAS